MASDVGIGDDSKAIEAQARRALANAGIGVRYARIKLADFGAPGEHLSASLKDDLETVRRNLALGMGWVIEGSNTSHDLAMVLGKGLLLSGMDVLATSLSDLSAAIESRDEDRIDSFAAPEVLIVSRMFDNAYAECPLAQREKFNVENFLLDAMDEERALIFAGTGKLKESTWWSNTFTGRLERTGCATITL